VTPDDRWACRSYQMAEEYKPPLELASNLPKKRKTQLMETRYYLLSRGIRPASDKIYRLWVKSLSNPTPTELTFEMKIDSSGYVLSAKAAFNWFASPRKRRGNGIRSADRE